MSNKYSDIIMIRSYFSYKYMRGLLTLFTLMTVYSASANIHRKDVDGYLVKFNKDTVPVKLSIPYSELGKTFDKYRMCEYIFMVLSNTTTKKVTPEEVAGYSFLDNNQWYHYISYDLNQTSDSLAKKVPSSQIFGKESKVKFLRRIVHGKASLYVYESQESVNASTAPGNSAVNDDSYGIGNTIIFYIQKGNLMTMISDKKFQKSIQPVIADNSILSDKILKREYLYKDLEKIVKEYNSASNQ